MNPRTEVGRNNRRKPNPNPPNPPAKLPIMEQMPMSCRSLAVPVPELLLLE
jgi:hypothetical protein